MVYQNRMQSLNIRFITKTQIHYQTDYENYVLDKGFVTRNSYVRKN